MNTSSSAASNSTTASGPINARLKPESTNIGWDYATEITPGNSLHVKCTLCGKEMSGGIYRIKQHIAHITGNVAKCPKSTKEDQEKCAKDLREAKHKKLEKRKVEDEVRSEVHIDTFHGDEVEGVLGSRKNPHFLGPMDRFATQINTDSPMGEAKRSRQANLNDTLFKERTHNVHQYVARWVYESGIPFNAIDNDGFRRLCEAIGQFGPGYQPPSQYMLREPLLKEEVERTKLSLKKHEEEWKINGCSIMTDAWSDRKRRSVMNLCVNCKEGTTFLSSKEDSESSHTGQYIFEYVDKFIDEIGPQYVVQVVTDNATNNMAAANLLKAKRPNIFWTSCATHTLNLMLEGIGKQPRFKAIIEKAKALTIFIYAHTKTLSLMRKFTNKHDIVRPGVTRFATSFLTLQSIMEKKDKLRLMFTSDDWADCKWSKSAKGKVTSQTILSLTFWNGVSLCLKVFAPLVKVLRLADGDKKPAMGFIYGELQKARNDIKEAFKNVETNYRPILAIIDAKSEGRLDSPLHLAGYILNPYYYYKDASIQRDQVVMDGFLACVESFFIDDLQKQSHVTNVEMWKYLRKEGSFGKQMAMAGCIKNDENFDPGI